MDHILSREPWSFDKSLVVLQQYNKLTPLEDLAFDKVSFWIHVIIFLSVIGLSQ